MADCLGVVLAGGLSSRMGTNKANLQLGKQTLLERASALLHDCGLGKVVISSKDQVSDLYDHQGPVGGIYSVFKQCRPHSMLIVPVDLPLLTATDIGQLKTIGELSNKAVCFQGHSLPLYLPINGFVENFFAKQSLFSQEKGPSIRMMLGQIPSQAIEITQPKSLTNVNTPSQWQQIQTHFNDKRI
ncbi:molybdenum cofactor guanylyltransferase [Thalassotalea fusca]